MQCSLHNCCFLQFPNLQSHPVKFHTWNLWTSWESVYSTRALLIHPLAEQQYLRTACNELDQITGTAGSSTWDQLPKTHSDVATCGLTWCIWWQRLHVALWEFHRIPAFCLIQLFFLFLSRYCITKARPIVNIPKTEKLRCIALSETRHLNNSMYCSDSVLYVQIYSSFNIYNILYISPLTMWHVLPVSISHEAATHFEGRRSPRSSLVGTILEIPEMVCSPTGVVNMERWWRNAGFSG